MCGNRFISAANKAGASSRTQQINTPTGFLRIQMLRLCRYSRHICGIRFWISNGSTNTSTSGGDYSKAVQQALDQFKEIEPNDPIRLNDGFLFIDSGDRMVYSSKSVPPKASLLIRNLLAGTDGPQTSKTVSEFGDKFNKLVSGSRTQ